MWLMYPLVESDIRQARRAVGVLLFASGLWYVSLVGILLVGSQPILEKIQGKFVILQETTDNKLPLLLLLGMFGLCGALRALAYRMSRVVAGAMSVPEGETLSFIGAAISIGTIGTLYFGISGMLALVAVAGAAFEMKFLRVISTLFGLCVSPRMVRKVHYFFYARTIWLALVVPAGLLMLFSHILIDIPTNQGGPYEVTIRTFTNLFYTLFKVCVVLCVSGLPLLVAAYWWLLLKYQDALPKLLDPQGPIPIPPPVKPGFDQLKQVLQPPTW